MAEVIRMPRMSDTMEEGVIVAWLKEEGETVESGETLAEVETDKATMELDSYSDGILLHIAVKEGPVPINGIIAVIGEEGEDWKAAITAVGNENEESVPSESPAQAEMTPQPQQVSQTSNGTSDTSSQRIKASPLAKNMAKEAGINLAGITGSGDQGRIVKRDIEALLGGQSPTQPAVTPTTPAVASPQPAQKPQSATTSPPAALTPGSNEGYEDKPMSQMRKAIAKNVTNNKFTAPHFYLTVELDMEKAIEARVKMNEIAPTKISFNDLVIKAAAAALRQHPEINVSFLEGNQVRSYKHIHIGVAVATPDGLVLPVIRHADIKSLSQINAEVRHLAGLAKERKLPPQDMQGSTFMISNLGMFGVEEFTAIINRPNACVMAVGAIMDKAVVKDGAIVPGKRMKVTISSDHRVVDGAIAAQFAQTFKSIIEDPIRMLV